MKLCLCLLFCISVVVWAPAAAHADEPPPPTTSEASRLKSEGDDAMQRLDYVQALALYDRAYALEQNPALLYNRGRALQALGRFPDAQDALEAFDAQAPDELKARVPKLRELLAEVRAKVSVLSLEANVSGARVLVNSRLVGTTPLGAPLRLNAGLAWVEVTAEGHHPFKQKVELTGGGRVSLSVVLHSKSTSGVLEVRSPVAGARVWVDGRRIGSVPAQTIVEAGSHEVVVRREGYEDATTRAVVRVGGTSRLDVPLREPPGITSRWWFWTGVGAVVLGGTALTVALLTEREPESGSIPPGQVSGPLVRF
ncbi:MAG: PEGA domain-containing protein [Polyangiaceae bacterium]|nr:PEGA domain-containing protein [Polyangiaceae bacterium]